MAQDEYIRTALRVPPELHRALHEAADKNGRSFNAEILGRLVESFGVPPEAAAQQVRIQEELIRLRLQQEKFAAEREIAEGQMRLDNLWMQRMLAQKEGASAKYLAELSERAGRTQAIIEDRKNSVMMLDRQIQEMAAPPLNRYTK